MIRLGLNDWSQPDQSETALAALRYEMRARRIAVSSLGTGLVIRDDSPAAQAELRACLRFAKGVGARGLRIMLGTYKQRYSDSAPIADVGGIVRWLGKATALAAEQGAEIWLETHNEFASGRALRPVLNAVGAPNLKILWDVIHPLEVGECIEDSLAFMGDDIAHVHIKDGEPSGDPDLANWRYTRVGEGTIPLATSVAALEARGYDGYYSLEWEPTWRPEIRGQGFEAETVIPHFAAFMRHLQGVPT